MCAASLVTPTTAPSYISSTCRTTVPHRVEYVPTQVGVNPLTSAFEFRASPTRAISHTPQRAAARSMARFTAGFATQLRIRHVADPRFSDAFRIPNRFDLVELRPAPASFGR